MARKEAPAGNGKAGAFYKLPNIEPMKNALARKIADTNVKSSRRSLKAITGNSSSPAVSSAVSLGENLSEYVVFVAVQGMERKDFSVTIINKKLVVSAIKKEARHCLSDSDEQSFPEWKETFVLPEDADTVMTAAIYKNGELEIHIPRGKDDRGATPVEVIVY